MMMKLLMKTGREFMCFFMLIVYFMNRSILRFNITKPIIKCFRQVETDGHFRRFKKNYQKWIKFKIHLTSLYRELISLVTNILEKLQMKNIQFI